MIRVIHANGLWNEYSDVIIEIVYYLLLYLVNKCYINNHSNEEFENFLETKPSGWVYIPWVTHSTYIYEMGRIPFQIKQHFKFLIYS